MGIITNKNTGQQPMSASGKTGAQVIKFIPACRVYIKAAESITAAPVQNYTTKSNGVTPDGWTDLGTMLGNAKLTYTKNKVKVETGVDKVLRASYVDTKTAGIEFDLAQLDDVTMEQITGMTASVYVSGSTVGFPVGQETMVTKALLIVYQNKLDGKEWILYHPAANIDFSIEEVDNGLALKCNADFTPFVADGQTLEEMFHAVVNA